jgi:hypothetical protein
MRSAWPLVVFKVFAGPVSSDPPYDNVAEFQPSAPRKVVLNQKCPIKTGLLSPFWHEPSTRLPQLRPAIFMRPALIADTL